MAQDRSGLSPEDVQQVIDDLVAPDAAGCTVMPINTFSARPEQLKERLYAAELFMGNCGEVTSGQLFRAAADEQKILLDRYAAEAIVSGLNSGKDCLGKPIPDCDALSVNLSLPLIRSEENLNFVVKTYDDGLKRKTEELVFECSASSRWVDKRRSRSSRLVWEQRRKQPAPSGPEGTE